jgi:hypothetical protein
MTRIGPDEAFPILTEKQIDALRSYGTEEEFADGAILFEEGDQVLIFCGFRRGDRYSATRRRRTGPNHQAYAGRVHW